MTHAQCERCDRWLPPASVPSLGQILGLPFIPGDHRSPEKAGFFSTLTLLGNMSYLVEAYLSSRQPGGMKEPRSAPQSGNCIHSMCTERRLKCANNPSRHLRRHIGKRVLVMQTSQHGLRQHTPIVRYFVAVWRSRRSRCGWRWNSWSQTAMWTDVIIVRDPINGRAFQVTVLLGNLVSATFLSPALTAEERRSV